MDYESETDLSTKLFSVFADIGLRLGDVAHEMKRERDWQKLARRSSAPVFHEYADNVIPGTGAGQSGTSQFGVVRLQGPDQGHFWYVRRIVVGGLTPTTAAAGRADVFVSAADHRNRTSLSQFALTDWRDQATSLPLIGTYSRGGMTLRFNEELFVCFSNVTNAQQYVAYAQFEDFEEAAMKEEWAV